VEQNAAVALSGKSQLNLILYRNDFTTAIRAAHAINQTSGADVANAVDGRTISINVPSGYGNRIVEFMSIVENATMDVDSPARVVVNEKTGTLVLGKEVKITEVSVIHGSLSLQVGTAYDVSQPEAFSQGKTTVVPEKSVSVQEEKGRTVTLREGASVEDVVRALNAIGAGPRDVISILQAIKAQGALQAELEII
jgi:flagellar P-ring protein precursor FlgI